MKKILLSFGIFCLLSQGVFAGTVQDNIGKIQGNSGYTGDIPSGGETKGFVGQVIADIFDPVGKILSNYILAFQHIIDINNNIPVWNSGTKVFDAGIMTDDGSKINVGGNMTITGNTKISGKTLDGSNRTIRDAGGGWTRTYGDTGWYNGTYGGGWYMSDGSWLRSYGNKSIYTWNTMQAGIFKDANNPNYYIDPSGNSNISTLRSIGGYTINNSSPTIYLQDTNNRSGMIHMNSNQMYFLRGSANNSTIWSTYNGMWPLQISMDNNQATFGGSIGIRTTPGGSFNNSKSIAIGDGDTGIRQDGDGVLELWSNNVERVHINSNGNVGIGRSNPASKLDVAGTIRAEKYCDENGANCTSSNGNTRRQYTDASFDCTFGGEFTNNVNSYKFYLGHGAYKCIYIFYVGDAYDEKDSLYACPSHGLKDTGGVRIPLMWRKDSATWHALWDYVTSQYSQGEFKFYNNAADWDGNHYVGVNLLFNATDPYKVHSQFGNNIYVGWSSPLFRGTQRSEYSAHSYVVCEL